MHGTNYMLMDEVDSDDRTKVRISPENPNGKHAVHIQFTEEERGLFRHLMETSAGKSMLESVARAGMRLQSKRNYSDQKRARRKDG